MTALAALLLTSAVARADPANPLTDLVDAAAQRLQVAEPVAAAKWHTGGAIEDPARVRGQLAGLAADATAEHLDPEYVTQVFADQIAATEALEYRRFADWKLDPSEVPADPPSLTESRAAIDNFNRAMVAQIGQQWQLLHSPECAGRLEAASRDVSAARRLDDLYQHALSVATQSYCRP